MIFRNFGSVLVIKNILKLEKISEYLSKIYEKQRIFKK